MKSVPLPSAATIPPLQIELPPKLVDATDSLDDMFARLSGASPSIISKPAKELSPVGPEEGILSFKNAVDNITAAANVDASSSVEAPTRMPPTLSLPGTRHIQGNATPARSLPQVQAQQPSSAVSGKIETQEREAEYIRKAAAYLVTLPTRPGDIAHIVKAVAVKLSTAYALDMTSLQSGEAQKLQASIVFAITKAVNGQIKLSSDPLPTAFVKGLLHDCNGNFLQLCAILVKSGYIALNDCKHVTEICQTILNVLPQADAMVPAASSETSEIHKATKPAAPSTQSGQTSTESATSGKLHSREKIDEKVKGDSLEGMKAWPTQEKREHGRAGMHLWDTTLLTTERCHLSCLCFEGCGRSQNFESAPSSGVGRQTRVYPDARTGVRPCPCNIPHPRSLPDLS